MCGIFGLIDTPWHASAERALGTLASRGPDARTWFEQDGCSLGHARLAVIDLVAGDQPMRSADGRLAIVFNGEIYNFRELRAELERAGHVFATQSDTEVLLQGYAAWGARLVPRLDGMFAVAIWDARARRLFAARDRIGVKPFFYSTAHGFAFGSTLAPFLALEGFPRALDYEAVRDYLAFQATLAPHTFLTAVRQLPPASTLVWQAGRLEIDRYWEIPARAASAPERDELLTRIDAALAASVRAQLVADVPLGAFLSGGIDSSLVVHYMAAADARPLKTFSMRFAEQGFDESGHAQAVAAHYGTEHHVIEAPAIDAAAFVSAIDALDEPLADPTYVTTHALARATRAQVTVALSGDGGDELFGGYARFRETAQTFARRPGQSFLRTLVERRLAPGALLRRSLYGAEHVFYRRVELGPWRGSRKSLARYLTPDALARARPEHTLALWRELAGAMDTAGLMRADLWTYLSEDCLAKTDRASMAHGLEVRVPLLGNAVLDAALPLPAAVHFANGDKSLLSALARRYLPETVWNRPKHGFSVPLRTRFADDWGAAIDEVVARSATIAPFLDAAQVQGLWADARRGRASRRLAYTIAVLLIWLDRHRLES